MPYTDTDASSCEAQPLEDYDLGLHIGSVFILLGVSMLGAFSPVMLSIFQHKGIIIAIRCGTIGKAMVGWSFGNHHHHPWSQL